MKTRSLIFVMLAALGFMFQSCSKTQDAGYNTNDRTIGGMVTYQSDKDVYSKAGNATVYIKFGSKEVTEKFDAATVADADGHYHFGGLNTGDYFVFAKYTDSKGSTFTCTGAGITLGKKTGEASADLKLQ